MIAASRVRQVYETSVLNALGVRLSEIRKSLYLEFLLIALVTALFAVLLGSAIAIPLLEWLMKLSVTDLIWVGLITALVVIYLRAAYLVAFYSINMFNHWTI